MDMADNDVSPCEARDSAEKFPGEVEPEMYLLTKKYKTGEVLPVRAQGIAR